MTKEEKIKEAWGKEFPTHRGVDANGWSIGIFWCQDIDFDKYDTWNMSGDWYRIRPKSLKGIEENNGWILGLPTEETDNVWLMTKDAGIVCSNYEYMKGDEAHWIENVTHYQPIEKPELPIY